MIFASASIPWFARHELRLAWRDWIGMMTAGKRHRGVILAVALVVFAIILHLMALGLVSSWAAEGIALDKPTLVLVTGSGFLFWTVMLSQSLESVTRAYYARSDLDLVLSSPASARRLFAVRTGATALSTMAIACLLASPIIDSLAILDGPHWLLAYGVLLSVSALSTAIAVLVTLGLFRLVGPKRTRLVAQIVAGIVGAGFVIGIQVGAIMAYGNMSRMTLFQSQEVVAAAPDLDSWLWAPAKAAMGDIGAMLPLLVVGLGALALVIWLSSASYSSLALAASSITRSRARAGRDRPFRAASQAAALRRKEWMLLRRDPWLLSQTLMQILYLIPPAILLWHNFGHDAGLFIVAVPVLVMAAGQLAGGLSWLAVSGEDAFDLVSTAPLPPRAILRAKIEAVLAVILIVMGPLILLMTWMSPMMALITAIGASLSAASATAIQLWFRTPMRRAMFRRRQVASRAATISEAIVAIMWAGTAALIAAGGWMMILAIGPALLALGTLAIAWAISPKGKRV